MAKIIIDNKTELPLVTAIEMVIQVIKQGRISNNNTQYCYATTFEVVGENYAVTTGLNKGSDKFVVQETNYNRRV